MLAQALGDAKQIAVRPVATVVQSCGRLHGLPADHWRVSAAYHSGLVMSVAKAECKREVGGSKFGLAEKSPF